MHQIEDATKHPEYELEFALRAQQQRPGNSDDARQHAYPQCKINIRGADAIKFLNDLISQEPGL